MSIASVLDTDTVVAREPVQGASDLGDFLEGVATRALDRRTLSVSPESGHPALRRACYLRFVCVQQHVPRAGLGCVRVQTPPQARGGG